MMKKFDMAETKKTLTVAPPQPPPLSTAPSSAPSDRLLRQLLREKKKRELRSSTACSKAASSSTSPPSSSSSSASPGVAAVVFEKGYMPARPATTVQLPLPTRKPLPTLATLCIKRIVDHSTSINDLSGLDEWTGLCILQEVVVRGLLTYRLAMVFINSFPDSEIAETLKSFDLFAAIPPPRIGPRGF